MQFRESSSQAIRAAPAPPSEGLSEQASLYVSSATPTVRDRRLALAVVLASLIAFLAMAPFARVPLAPVPGFIPVYQSALVINDLVTAVLLFGQFGLLRSRALLVLAGAYLFTAAMATVHTFTFPGVFSPSGLLSAGPQTTAWLYMFWHGGFPLLVIVYALLKDRSDDAASPSGSRRHAVAICVAAVLAAACGFTLLATAGHQLLPTIMRNNGYAPAMSAVAGSTCLLSVIAAIVVWQRKQRSVLDLWLAVSMCALSLDVALSAGLNAGRYDLGFYAGRIYGLMATSFLLVLLLIESNRLYGVLLETFKNDRAKAVELRRLSTIDPLTRIANRRAFDEAIDLEWRRALRHRTPLCLILIDVDCFKRYNDRYGHVAGDQCLSAVARALAKHARRAGEMAARYGGEEFAVLLPQVDMEEACEIAQRLCEAVRELDIPHEDSTAASHVTISAGVADALEVAPARASSERSETTGHEPGPTLLIEHADAGLYAAKSSGRNRIARSPARSGPSIADVPKLKRA
jgi:diguanylate cyclase (GGDEF)-like protein